MLFYFTGFKLPFGLFSFFQTQNFLCSVRIFVEREKLLSYVPTYIAVYSYCLVLFNRVEKKTWIYSSFCKLFIYIIYIKITSQQWTAKL